MRRLTRLVPPVLLCCCAAASCADLEFLDPHAPPAESGIIIETGEPPQAPVAPPPAAPKKADTEHRAEIVALPPPKAPPPQKAAPAAVKAQAEKAVQPAAAPEKAQKLQKVEPEKVAPASRLTRPVVATASLPVMPTQKEPGFATVLSGTLASDREIGPLQSPALLKGNVVIPVGVTLRIKAGAVLCLQADEKAPPPQQPGVPDASQSGVLWVWGTLLVEGITGNPVEIASRSRDDSSILFYGQMTSRIDGARLKNVTLTQTGGSVLWTNCELLASRHVALAGGASVFTQCSLKNCGGVFAAYDAGPWSLLMRRNLFESCREGLVLGSDPGEARLVIERNHFVATRGAHIRVLPTATALARRDAQGKPLDLEMLIGENWYGTAVPEEIDLRIVDRRSDPALRARLNTRPPAERPYADIGAGVPMATVAAAQKEQQPALQKLLQAHPFPRPKAPPPEKLEPASMSKPVRKEKS